MTPAIIVIPGLCSVGSIVNAPLKQELQRLDYSEILLINLASVDALDALSELQPNPLEADIAHIRLSIMDLVESGKDVLVVAHSYGGTPSLYACEGLWKHERQSKGLNGGVLKVVLLSSSLTLPGDSVAGVRAKWSEQSGAALDDTSSAKIEMVHNVRFLCVLFLL